MMKTEIQTDTDDRIRNTLFKQNQLSRIDINEIFPTQPISTYLQPIGSKLSYDMISTRLLEHVYLYIEIWNRLVDKIELIVKLILTLDCQLDLLF